jgi:hypothetical protein
MLASQIPGNSRTAVAWDIWLVAVLTVLQQHLPRLQIESSGQQYYQV